MNTETKIALILSFGRSLIDEITESLRAAAVRLEGSVIHVTYFFNCDITDEIQEHYLAFERERQDKIAQQCLQLGIDHFLSDVSEPLEQTLTAFFVKRSRLH